MSITQPYVVPAAAAPSSTFVAGTSVAIIDNGFAAGTITFSNLNGGVNFPSGALVVVGVFQDQSGTTLTSPQIGGNAASIVSGAQDSTTKNTFYQAVMAAPSTDNFTFTNGNAVANVGVASCYMTGMNSAVSDADNLTHGSTAQPLVPTNPVTVPSGGFGIVFFGVLGIAGGANTVTWTNTTAAGGDVNSGPTGTAQIGLAHTATSGSWAPTVVGNTTSFTFIGGMSAAAWGP